MTAFSPEINGYVGIFGGKIFIQAQVEYVYINNIAVNTATAEYKVVRLK